MTNQQDEFLRQNIQTTISSGHQADNKAQALLGFTGIFLNLSFGAFLSLGGTTKMSALALVPVLVFYMVSITLSIIALWSRGVFGKNVRGLDYFGHIANYPNADALLQDLRAHFTEKPREEEMVASLWQVSRITKLKHQLVNLAFVFSGLALVTFLIIALYILA